jgi:ubiquinone biosynthesis monooxygenase Coq7
VRFLLQGCNNLYPARIATKLSFHTQKWELPDMDSLFIAADTALRTLFARPRAAKACPTLADGPTELNDDERRRAAGLMRVNHVGEICAQALYAAQALATPSPGLRKQFNQASADEVDHLAWTAERLQELGARPSVLNPLWYLGAFGLGLLAGRMGNAVSLGFVVETEHQVGAHLKSHLETLPTGDHASRAIVAQMYDDEMRHASEARAAGAVDLPQPVKQLMRAAAKVMTTVAERI